jgi:lantibiotic biosynthesis protein
MTPHSKEIDPFLSAAAGIGLALCREAIWDASGRMCNWMGRSPNEITKLGGPVTPTAAALGPDLYGGSLWVAWFLAQLSTKTGDPDFRRTALAAIARTLRQLERSSHASAFPVSYYSGLVGAAFIMDRIATLTDEPALGEQVDVLLERASSGATGTHVLDVIGGNAGAIPALLALSRGERRPAARILAEQLGEELLKSAIRQGPIWTWEAEKAAGPAIGKIPLAGFAHGNAGLGLALFELYAATGKQDYLIGGRGAFAYEDGLFDTEAGNWPDLRQFESVNAPSRQFTVAWCHGAPGIALARMRAAILDPESSEAYRASARTALATTRTTLDNMLALPRHDATLCHGVGGLSEIVWTGGQWLGDAALSGSARAAGRSLIEKHASRGSWPCGVATTGPNPSLMLGTAGIGMHFLQLHDPDTVPPLLIVSV